jgi:putative hydrolase of HD superfamily
MSLRSEPFDDGRLDDLAIDGRGLPVRHERLRRQLEFSLTADRLKGVQRRTLLVDGSRRENAAEHSWHLALLALLLEEHGPGRLDRLRVLELVIVHDLVEVEAGDTFAYDEEALPEQDERERRAADALFGRLPGDQATRLRRLWDEFEARETPEARFAKALDRIQPVLANFATGGHSWRLHGVARSQVLARMEPVRDASETLWRYVVLLVDEGTERGWLRP